MSHQYLAAIFIYWPRGGGGEGRVVPAACASTGHLTSLLAKNWMDAWPRAKKSTTDKRQQYLSLPSSNNSTRLTSSTWSLVKRDHVSLFVTRSRFSRASPLPLCIRQSSNKLIRPNERYSNSNSKYWPTLARPAASSSVVVNLVRPVDGWWLARINFNNSAFPFGCVFSRGRRFNLFRIVVDGIVE